MKYKYNTLFLNKRVPLSIYEPDDRFTAAPDGCQAV